MPGLIDEGIMNGFDVYWPCSAIDERLLEFEAELGDEIEELPYGVGGTVVDDKNPGHAKASIVGMLLPSPYIWKLGCLG